MKIKELFAITILILFLMPFVSPAQPTVAVQSATYGYIIEHPIADYLKRNTPHNFYFHVFDSNNSLPVLNSTASLQCIFHLYNPNGTHILKVNNVMHDDTYDWEQLVDGGNFSVVGQYSYVFQCNDSLKGGFYQHDFWVTNSGFDATTGRALFDMGLLFVLVMLLFGAMAIFVMFDKLLVRFSMLGVSYLLLIAISFISWQLANDFLLSAPFLIEIFRITFFVLIVGFFPAIIGGFVWYFLMLMKIKEIQNLMEKGFSFEDAERRQGRKYK